MWAITAFIYAASTNHFWKNVFILLTQSNFESLTSDERETRSLGDSVSSGCKARESQESEVGVSGRGLCVLWTQELMHTKASAASRSLYSRVEEQDFSLSCLFLSIITSQMSTRLDYRLFKKSTFLILMPQWASL